MTGWPSKNSKLFLSTSKNHLRKFSTQCSKIFLGKFAWERLFIMLNMDDYCCMAASFCNSPHCKLNLRLQIFKENFATIGWKFSEVAISEKRGHHIAIVIHVQQKWKAFRMQSLQRKFCQYCYFRKLSTHCCIAKLWFTIFGSCEFGIFLSCASPPFGNFGTSKCL